MKPFPAERVLVPVDLTRVSADAWEWARLLAAPGAALRALYVRSLPPAPVLGLPAPPLSDAARARLVERLRQSYPGARASVEEGDPAALIARASRRAGLVVMGTHGRTGLDRAVLGSVSEAVVRDSSAPTLVVRGAPRRVKSVLAPTNLTAYSRRGLELAAETAAFLGAELVLLYVAPDPQKAANPGFFTEGFLQGLPAELARAVKPRLVKRAGRPVEQILRESRRHGLVVLTAHRKPLLTELVIGTTVERVLRHCPAPVLAAPSS